MFNAVTVDIEEYFTPTEVQAAVDQNQWVALELLDARRTKATFSVLGWVADRNPRAIQESMAAGHEIGSIATPTNWCTP